MPSPIHVLHLINSLAMGGAEKRLTEIVENLPREEFRFTVVCLTHTGHYEERVRDAGARIEVINYKGLRKNGRLKLSQLLQPMLAMRRFDQWLQTLQPDVVQTWIPISNFIGARAMCHWRFRHMALIASRVFTGEYRDANAFIPLAEAWAARRADFIYCNSSAVAQDVIARETTVDPSIIRIIRNGVDTQRFHPAEDKNAVRRALDLPEQKPLLLTVGALRPHKGHVFLLEVIEKVAQIRPDALLMLAGADQGQGPLLKKIAQEKHLEPHVQFLGARSDIPQLMQAADALVLPSSEEGLPNVLLESQACALPSVATALPGCIEALDNGRAGVLTPSGNAEAMAKAILDLLDRPMVRSELGTQARLHVEQNFSQERMFREFANFYREALAKRAVRQSYEFSSQ